MDKQIEIDTLKEIAVEFEKIFNPIFSGKSSNIKVDIKHSREHDDYFLNASYTTHANKTFGIGRCNIFLHPKLGLVFNCSVGIGNKNPAPNENYHRSDFSIKDFTTFKGIPYNDLMTWVRIENIESGVKPAKELFEYLRVILLREDMQLILFADFWENVPIDYSPYK